MPGLLGLRPETTPKSLTPCSPTPRTTFGSRIASPTSSGRRSRPSLTRPPCSFSPTETEVKALLASVHEGKPVASLAGNQFYALALSGSGGRVVIRDWLETTVAHVRSQPCPLLPGARPSGPRRPAGAATWTLRASWSRLFPAKGQNPWRELSPNLASQFVRAALSGGPWPSALLGGRFFVPARSRVSPGPGRRSSSFVFYFQARRRRD